MKQAETCIILAGGDVQEKIECSGTELVICADGGYRHALKQHIRPDMLIGDFDSYTDALPEGIPVIRYPAEKDVSDTWACVEYARGNGCCNFRIYGAFGGERIDHSLANLQLFRHIAEENLTAEFFCKNQILRNLNAGKSIVFSKKEIPCFSIFALSETCQGVTVRGAKYPLADAELKNSFPLGLSNETAEENAEISVQEGNLLLVMTKR